MGVTILSGAVLIIGPRIATMATALGLTGGAAAVAAPEVGAFGAAVDLVTGPIGLVTIGVGLAAAALLTFTGRNQSAVKPLGDVTTALNDNYKAYMADVKAKLLSQVVTSDNIPTLAAAGISIGLVTSALGGNKEALAKVNALLDAGITKNTVYGHTLSSGKGGTGQVSVTSSLTDVGLKLQALLPIFGAVTPQLAADTAQWWYLHGGIGAATGALNGFVNMAGRVPGLGGIVPGSFAAPGLTPHQQHNKKLGLPYASGGLVRGRGTSTSDSVPIMASAGEFMIKAAAVQRTGLDVLQAINAGRSPGKTVVQNTTINSLDPAQIEQAMYQAQRRMDLLFGG
jgi:hypothetical protein